MPIRKTTTTTTVTEVKFNMIRSICEIEKGISLRFGSWGDKAPRYDLRQWYTMPNGEERCKKGISFDKADGVAITNLVEQYVLTKKSQTVGFGKYELRIQKTKFGIDLALWNGSFRFRGVNFTTEGIAKLHGSLLLEFPKEDTAESIQKTETVVKTESVKVEQKQENKTVRSLCSLPVNDINYPVNNATIEELEEAIAYMEEHPHNNATRLTRCKSKLNSLKNGTARRGRKKKEATAEAKVVKPVEQPKIEEEEDDPNVVYTFDDAEEKLNSLRFKYTGHDHKYVIDGLVEACMVDDDLVQKVMSKKKSYEKGFQYLAEQARNGRCIMIGNNCGMMDENTALELMLEYFKKENKNESEQSAERKVGKEVHDTVSADHEVPDGVGEEAHCEVDSGDEE